MVRSAQLIDERQFHRERYHSQSLSIDPYWKIPLLLFALSFLAVNSLLVTSHLPLEKTHYSYTLKKTQKKLFWDQKNKLQMIRRPPRRHFFKEEYLSCISKSIICGVAGWRRATCRCTSLLHPVEMNAGLRQNVAEWAQPCAVPLLRRLRSNPKHTCEQLAGNEVRT